GLCPPAQQRLRACELPWDFVQTASQPQRGCGRARHPRTQPRWGRFVLTRWTQGSSLLATLGFVAESLRDSHDSSPEMWVMMRPLQASCLHFLLFCGTDLRVNRFAGK